MDRTAIILQRNSESLVTKQIIIDCLRIFRQCCPLGAEVQTYIVRSLSVDVFIHDLILSDLHAQIDQITTVSLQVLANLVINNTDNQLAVWNKFNQFFINHLSETGYPHKDICRMIIYNIYCVGGLLQDQGLEFLKILLRNLDEHIQNKDCTLPDFLQIFLEHFITKQKRIASMYLKLDSTDRILMLHFLVDHIKEGHSNGSPVSTELLQCVCKEFKKKSDCVLKTETTYLNRIEPKEVMALLEVIAQASGEKCYGNVFGDDGSLFLNAGCLLRNIQALGKQSENVFSPIQKLEQIAPSSTASGSSIETDISYSLKTMLVRTVGNLAYRNMKNQDLVRLGGNLRYLRFETTACNNFRQEKWRF